MGVREYFQVLHNCTLGCVVTARSSIAAAESERPVSGHTNIGMPLKVDQGVLAKPKSRRPGFGSIDWRCRARLDPRHIPGAFGVSHELF